MEVLWSFQYKTQQDAVHMSKWSQICDLIFDNLLWLYREL